MEIQGRIIRVLQLQSGTGQQSGKAWSKQEYILETLDQYPKKICFNLWGERIQQFSLKEGEEITAQIDIESREYNGRWYTDVRAWRVDRGLVSLQQSDASPMPAPAAQPSAVDSIAAAPRAADPMLGTIPAGGDDLPF